MRNFFIILILLTFTGGGAARAEERLVQVRQVNPEGPYETVICGEGAARFRFRLDGDYLFTWPPASDDFHMSVGKDGPSSQRVSLYVPHPLARSDSEHSLVLRNQMGSVADLEITVRPASSGPVNPGSQPADL